MTTKYLTTGELPPSPPDSLTINMVPGEAVPSPVRSRVRHHIQTMAFVRITIPWPEWKFGNTYELAICENLTAERYSVHTNEESRSWSRWKHAEHADFEQALAHITSRTDRYISRTGGSIVSQPLLIPQNEVDVNTIRTRKRLQNGALKYGSEHFDGLEKWLETQQTIEAATAGKPAAAGGSPPPPPASPSGEVDDATKLLEELRRTAGGFARDAV